jgi:hypothetical protein
MSSSISEAGIVSLPRSGVHCVAALVLPSSGMKRILRGRPLALLAFLFCTQSAGAADVELAPFAGVQFPGAVATANSGRTATFGIGVDYGAALDVAVADGWRVELLYSRQGTDLSTRGGGGRFALDLERYFIGIEEEKGGPQTRFFGVFLAGLTRFAPGLEGYDSDVRATLGLSLGIKHALSDRFGLRAEGRAFFVNVDSGGGVLCNGSCLFVFRGSGLWQGDLSAGVTLGF